MKLQMNDKIRSLGTAVSLMVFSVFVFGLGILWIFQFVKVNDVVGGMLSAQIAILLFAFSLIKFEYKALSDELFKRVTFKDIIAVIGFTIIMLILNVVFSLATDLNSDHISSQELNNIDIIALFLASAGLAPICEELAFRMGLKKLLVDEGNWSKGWYVFISSALFGLLHWSPGQTGALYILFTFFAGLVFSLVYLRSGKISLAILVHMMYNGIVLYATFY